MTEEATAHPLAKAAVEVHNAARVHKRSEFAHRKQARALMQRFDELRRECEALGIKVTIDQAKGEDTHGQRTRPDPRS